MKSEYRIWVRYFNFVGQEILFHEYEGIRDPCRRVVSELAWALDIVPRLPCIHCGEIMVFAPGSMAFACGCEKAKIITATSDEAMKWHIEHWKDLNPKQTAEDIEKYGKDGEWKPFSKENEPRFGPILMPDGTVKRYLEKCRDRKLSSDNNRELIFCLNKKYWKFVDKSCISCKRGIE